MKNPMISLAALGLFAAATNAGAALSNVTPSGFLVRLEAPVRAAPSKLFTSLTQLSRWWDGQHTYSGNPANLILEPRAGGCWCERWEASSIEHARVLYIARDRMLRMEGALGPLQELAVNGLLQFAIEPAGEESRMVLTYRVRGTADAALDKTAKPVEKVLAEALERLVRFSETGSPVPIPPPPPLAELFFESGGVRLRYSEEGQGPEPVILLHDAGSSIEAQWIAPGIMRALVREEIFRVIALDLPGHGKSARPETPALARDVLALMDHLRLQRAHVVGYGLGAKIAAYLAANHPDRLATIALTGGAQAKTGELAVTDEQMRQVGVPTLGIVGNNDPAAGDLLALRRVMPKLVRLHAVEGANHETTPAHPEYLTTLAHFLRYHPTSLGRK